MGFGPFAERLVDPAAHGDGDVEAALGLAGGARSLGRPGSMQRRRSRLGTSESLLLVSKEERQRQVKQRRCKDLAAPAAGKAWTLPDRGDAEGWGGASTARRPLGTASGS